MLLKISCCIISFLLWLISIPLYVRVCVYTFSILLYMCMYMLHLFHLSIDGHLDCFYVLTTVNSNTVNTVCMYHFKLVFFGYMPRSGIAGSYGNFTHGHHQMVNTKIRLIIIFAAKDGEALYSQQK